MPRIVREADIEWEGTTARGSGVVRATSSPSGFLTSTIASRVEIHQGKTSPEELIAAAHATCFTMALALVLGEEGTPPTRIATDARCVLDEVDGAPRITRVSLAVRGDVDGIDEPHFRDAVDRAATLCPVSNALRGNVEISLEASLGGA